MLNPANLPPARQVITVHLVLASALLVVMATFMWSQPILTDEIDFYISAENWFQERYRIPHPQAYVHTLQLSFALFGHNIGAARLPGLLTALVNLLLIPQLVYAFFEQNKQRGWIAIATLWLYAISPLIVQNMMMLDIDNTLLTTILLVMLLYWKKGQSYSFIWRVVGLGFIFSAALWVKLPTPVLLMGCFFIFSLVQAKIKRAGEIILASGIGIFLLLITFAIYDHYTNFGADKFFGPTFARISSGGGSANIKSILLQSTQGMGVFIIWLSLPVLFILLAVSAGTLIRLIRFRLEDRDFLLLYTAVVSLFYGLGITPAWGYPRYQAPVIPIIAILIVAAFVPAFQTLPKHARLAVIIAGVAAFFHLLLFIGDPLWPLYRITYETNTGDLWERLNQGLSEAIKLATPVIIILIVMYLLSLRWKIKPLIMFTAVLGILSFAYPAGMTAIQVTADYSTRYRYTYNYNDMRQTVAELQETGGYLIAVKELLYYTNLPGEDAYFYICGGCSPQTLLDRIKEKQVTALAWTTKEETRFTDISRDPTVIELLNRCYTRHDNGLFIAYIRKIDGGCSE